MSYWPEDVRSILGVLPVSMDLLAVVIHIAANIVQELAEGHNYDLFFLTVSQELVQCRSAFLKVPPIWCERRSL
jgi:hypothetical protein